MGDKSAARAAYGAVLRRLPEMEPSQRAVWQQATAGRGWPPCKVLWRSEQYFTLVAL